MLMYPSINPVAFHLGNWPVYWYGLMYMVGFLGGWVLLSLRVRYSQRGFTQDQVSDVVFCTALGAIIGGRVGYMLFYSWQDWLANPILIFETWKGGMSFHGGLLGVLIGMWWLARRWQKPFLALTDFVSPVIPFGLAAGRIGNFINGELWGRVTDVPWGMVFPHVDMQPRHPSQLYEFALEGVVLFVVLWCYSRKPRPLGAVSGLFAIGYAFFRICIECFRQPDAPIGYIAFGWMTEGQLLSIPLLLVGVALVAWAYKRGDNR
jgi:phosphatidylglycerol:prolipoprotein diacylglycerol transferase